MNARTSRETPTTTTYADAPADAPLCQSCQCPIRPDEAVHAAPGPNGATWCMHASVALCLSRLTDLPRDRIVAALVRP